MATLLAILAISTTVILFLAGRRRKRLSYEVSDTRVLGTVEPFDSHRVEILFDGTPVTEVRLVTLRVECTGNEPIQSSDYERPLRIHWSEPARVLSAEIVSVNPDNLQPIINVGATEIVVEPLLLNPQDGLLMNILIDRAAKLFLDGRIVGVKHFTKSVPGTVFKPAKYYFWRIGVVQIAITLVVLLMYAGEHLGFWAAKSRAEHGIVLAVLIATVFVFIELLKSATADLISYFKNKKEV